MDTSQLNAAQQAVQGYQMPSGADVYGQASTQFNLPDLYSKVQNSRQAVQGADTALANVDPSVTGRTQGSLVSEAARQRLVAQERAPMSDQLTQLSGLYQNTSGDYQNALSQAQQMASLNMQGAQNKFNSLQQVYSNLADQQKLAEQAREANQTAANSAASSGSGIDAATLAALLGGSSSGTKGSMSRNSVGGYSFTDANGTPITMGRYLDMNGDSAQDALDMLAQGSQNDKMLAAQIGQAISGGMTQQQLEANFPQVFGG